MQENPANDNSAANNEETAGDTNLTFASLGLSEETLQAVTEVGYETPSAIQAATIPHLLEGRDVVGMAQTGTGKTAAFALPILSAIKPGSKKPQALVIAPTRELALQVSEAFESFSKSRPNLHLLPVYGGQSYGQQLSALKRGVDVVVGTPGRTLDHINRGSLDLSEVTHVVLDEADEMLKMGFLEDVEAILAATPAEKQVALFSATMPARIRSISKKYLNDPVEVSIERETRTATNVTQHYVVVSYSQKLEALTRILEVQDFDGLIVFTRTRGESETVSEKLRARGYNSAVINGDIPQPVRERAVQQLRDGKIDVLVATDVAARGLDVERISLVINYDLPIDAESYVHRIGRTGRAGRSGSALSFVTPRERRLLQSIERSTRQKMTAMQLPRVPDVNASRLSRFDRDITYALQDTERLERFREIIDHYVRHHDVPEVDVAAALAIVAQGSTPLLLDEEDDRLFAKDRKAAARFDEGGDDKRKDRREGGSKREERRRDGSKGKFNVYRIEVGKRHQVRPGQIVGALANEGNLQNNDFGRITIRESFSLVELPEGLSSETFELLRDTRISGRKIEIKPDTGGHSGGYSGGHRDERRRDDRGRDDRGRDDRGRGRDGHRKGGRDNDYGKKSSRFDKKRRSW